MKVMVTHESISSDSADNCARIGSGLPEFNSVVPSTDDDRVINKLILEMGGFSEGISAEILADRVRELSDDGELTPGSNPARYLEDIPQNLNVRRVYTNAQQMEVTVTVPPE